MTVLIIDVAEDPTTRLSKLAESGITTIFGSRYTGYAGKPYSAIGIAAKERD
jgi:hypothetical protein